MEFEISDFIQRHQEVKVFYLESEITPPGGLFRTLYLQNLPINLSCILCSVLISK